MSRQRMHTLRRVITGVIIGLAVGLVGALLLACTTGLAWGEAPHTTQIHLGLGLAYVRLDRTEGDPAVVTPRAATIVSSLRGGHADALPRGYVRLPGTGQEDRSLHPAHQGHLRVVWGPVDLLSRDRA